MRGGIAGFGKMGSAIAARLVETGMNVTIWNREARRVKEAGFMLAETPRALAQDCDVIISSLFDDEAVTIVYCSAEGLAAGGSGKLFIEMSTVKPATQQAIAAEVMKAGGAFIECPVSGTTGPARSGQLLGLPGGLAADVDRARPVLEKLRRRIEHIGPIGAGATAKLAIILPLLAFWQSFGEAMALMRPLGKSPEWLVQLFGATAAAPAVLKVKAESIVAALGGRDDFVPTFTIDTMRKDLLLALGQSKGYELPVANTVLASFDEAAASGWGPRDCAWIPAYWVDKADPAKV